MADYSAPIEAMQEQANAISSHYFDNTLRKVVYQESVLLKRLLSKNKVKIKGGDLIQWPVRVKKLNTAKAVDPRAAVNWETRDTRVAAQLGWKYYMGTTLIQWDELRQNKGKAKLIDLIKDKSEEIREDMIDKLLTDMYATSDGTNSVASLNTLIGTGTFAGISPTELEDSTRWQSIVEDAASHTLYFYEDDASDYSLAGAINAATFNNQRPTLIITTDDIYTGIERYQEEKRQITKDGGLIDMGYDNVKFKGIPIVADKRCPDGYMFGIDEDALELVVDPDYDMALTKWEKHEKYPNALFKAMSWAGNFKIAYRHTSFKFTDIDAIESAS